MLVAISPNIKIALQTNIGYCGALLHWTGDKHSGTDTVLSEQYQERQKTNCVMLV